MPLDSGSDNEDKTLGSSSSGCDPLLGSRINKEEQDIIDRLVILLDESDSPSEQDLEQITPFPSDDSEEGYLNQFKHLTEIEILTVQLIIEFARKVPGFDTISRRDQTNLLKRRCHEVTLLWAARKYDMMTDSIYFTKKQLYTRENYRNACMGSPVDPAFDFYRTMCILEVDDVEYALLTAIVILSECPCLCEPKKVEKIQEGYIEILKNYVIDNRPPGTNYFAKLLSMLAELRILNILDRDLGFFISRDLELLPGA